MVVLPHTDCRGKLKVLFSQCSGEIFPFYKFSRPGFRFNKRENKDFVFDILETENIFSLPIRPQPAENEDKKTK